MTRQFRLRACTVISVNESWLSGSPDVQDVLIAFAALGRTDRSRIAGRSASERAWPGLGLKGKGKRRKDEEPTG